jgi:tripeptidyl-peptidase-1
VIQVELSHQAASNLLQTKFHHAVNNATMQSTIRAGDYFLPAEVDDAVAAAYGLHGLPLPPRQALAAPGTPASVTPAVIEKYYDVSGVTPSGSTKNRQAVAEFQGQTEKPADLAQFFKQFVPSAEAKDGSIYKFVGDDGTGVAGIESSLDVDYIMGVAPGLLTEFWYYKGSDFCGDLADWTGKIISTTQPPLVHSVSYGWQGELTQIGCKQANVKDVDNNLAKLATMGITIIFASGDSGSGYNPSVFASGDSGHKKPKLYPSWPASSPWVTAVGATRFIDQKVGNPEMASDQFGSGGGFSTMFDAFKEQKAAVAQYLKIAKNLPPKGSYPPGGRATPDVSALGEGFQVVANGQVSSIGGTSAAAPTFAGLVSLLNEARIKAGKPAMGYLNPFLYQNADAFNDVTVGTNAIGRGTGPIKYGFACAKGWDPATGLGTPNFEKLLSKAMAGSDASLII